MHLYLAIDLNYFEVDVDNVDGLRLQAYVLERFNLRMMIRFGTCIAARGGGRLTHR